MPYEHIPLETNEPESSEHEEVLENPIEMGFDVDSDYARLTDYWKKYQLPDEPPRKGTIAHKRLHDSCSKYVDVVRHQGEKLSVGNMQEDSEDYFASKTGRIVGRSSDRYRRELHNEIAIMLYGRPRSGMETSLAEHILEFALHYIPE